MSKRNLLLIMWHLMACTIMAQQNEKSEIQKIQDDFEKYKKEETDDFENYREQENKKFADYMKQEWEAFNAFKGTPVPKSPDPVKLPVKEDPNKKPVDNPVPKGILFHCPNRNHKHNR